MEIRKKLYRIVGLDGNPHPVLDTPFETKDAAMGAANQWCDGQGSECTLSYRGIGVEVLTGSGEWRTVGYPENCLR